MFGREEVAAAIQMRTEANTFVADFTQSAEREDLKAAGVREHGAGPTDEAMQAAEAADYLMTGAQVKVVGVAENDFSAEGLERVLRNGLDRAGCADGHEDGRLDGAVGEMKLGAAAAGCCFRDYFEGGTHFSILAGRSGGTVSEAR